MLILDIDIKINQTLMNYKRLMLLTGIVPFRDFSFTGPVSVNHS